MSIPYKSFCWSFGTTSFRTKNFNKTIEEQLFLLNEFWAKPENTNESWSSNNALQSRYYDFMKDKEFVEGSANNKPKDAREKTSGLVDIGLIDTGRKLTEAGQALYQISLSNDFSSDNFFQIPKDSYIYLKQLLKTYYEIDNQGLRPFIVLLYALKELETLSFEEFTYLIPLCTSPEYTESIISNIKDFRRGNMTVDEIIIDRLLQMSNYQDALTLFKNNAVTENIICEIGLNRKSRAYDKTYLPLYNALHKVYLENDINNLYQVYNTTFDIKIGKLWRAYIFNTTSKVAIERNPERCKNPTVFDNVTDENGFKEAFFKIMHLLKAKATLSDYFDLNKRYIRTTDIFLFDDNTVKLDVVPKHFFNAIAETLYAQAYIATDNLFSNCNIEEISESLIVNETVVIEGVNEEFGTAVTTIAEARLVLEDNRYMRLQNLIDEKFTDNNIIELLNHFESRNDNTIREMVTDDADIPTIFEYVLGILWYKVSERQGKILDYMKLSLDANLLPKTHAAGGEADIVYEYVATEHYPEHTMLLEATLADGTNQRRMEMEPVSRHLGRHLLRTSNMNSYCVFATNYLDINVISDFRARRSMPYYDTQDYSRSVNGMKIIPIQTSELKDIVRNHKTYKELYDKFEQAYNSNLLPHEWYENCIKTN